MLRPISRPPACGTRALRLKTAGPMANRAIWNVRRRHEWLATPLKGKRLKRRKRLRIGLQQAMDRKQQPAEPAAEG
jgi:hypothetical protein